MDKDIAKLSIGDGNISPLLTQPYCSSVVENFSIRLSASLEEYYVKTCEMLLVMVKLDPFDLTQGQYWAKSRSIDKFVIP